MAALYALLIGVAGALVYAVEAHLFAPAMLQGLYSTINDRILANWELWRNAAVIVSAVIGSYLVGMVLVHPAVLLRLGAVAVYGAPFVFVMWAIALVGAGALLVALLLNIVGYWVESTKAMPAVAASTSPGTALPPTADIAALATFTSGLIAAAIAAGAAALTHLGPSWIAKRCIAHHYRSHFIQQPLGDIEGNAYRACREEEANLGPTLRVAKGWGPHAIYRRLSSLHQALDARIATHLALRTPDTVAAGVPFDVRLRALDMLGRPTSAFSSPLHLRTSDGTSVQYDFHSGDVGEQITQQILKRVGLATLTAQADPQHARLPQVSRSVRVKAGPAYRLQLEAPTEIVAGSSTPLKISARDSCDNLASGYAGRVQIVSQATSRSVNFGLRRFNPKRLFLVPSPEQLATRVTRVTQTVAGDQTITATDQTNPGITGTTVVRVVPGAIARFEVLASPDARANAPMTITTRAEDKHGNRVTKYAGSVRLLITDASGTAHFEEVANVFSGANGEHRFQLSLSVSGDFLALATDTGAAAIKGELRFHI